MSVRPAICVYSNCQGQALAGWLARHPALQGWDFVFLRAWLAEEPTPADAERCHLLIHQPSWGEPPFAARLAPHVRRLAVPLLSCSVLWPYAFDRPDEPAGWRFPYGDRFLLQRLKAGDTPEAATAAYLAQDLATRLKLDRLLALEVQRWQQDDVRCGTALAPFMARELLRQRLFFTPDHPTDVLLLQLANQVLLRLRLQPFAEPDWAGHRHQLAGVEVPVHPAVVRHFGLPWVQADTTWPLHGGHVSLDTAAWYQAYATALQRPGTAQGLQDALDALAAGRLPEVLNLLWLLNTREPHNPAVQALHAVVQAMAGRPAQSAALLRGAFMRDDMRDDVRGDVRDVAPALDREAARPAPVAAGAVPQPVSA